MLRSRFSVFAIAIHSFIKFLPAGEFTCEKCSTEKRGSKGRMGILARQFFGKGYKKTPGVFRPTRGREVCFPRYHLYSLLSHKSGLTEHPAMPLPCNGRTRSALLGPLAFPRTTQEMKFQTHSRAPRTNRELSDQLDLRPTLSPSTFLIVRIIHGRRSVVKKNFSQLKR